MKKILTSRQRVEIALDHKEPDRLPCDMTIEPTVYGDLTRYLGCKFEPLWWDDWNHAYPSVEVLEKLKVDVYHIPLKITPKGFDINKLEFKDEWGITKKKVINSDGSFMYCLTDYPLKDAESVEDILSYKWPKPEDIIDVTGYEEIAGQLYNETDLALTATFGGNVFERSHYLRSMDNFLVDLIAEPEMAAALMAKVLEIQMGVETLVLNAIGKYLTYMRFNGEDFGTQSGLLISNELFQSVVRPHLQKEWRTAKEKFLSKNPKGKISIHSCGSIFDLIPAFIDMGADILNPIQPNAKGMDTKQIKELFDGSLCFHGGIDTQGVLNSGNQEDIRAEVRKRISDLAPGGGYICAPAHNIQYGMPITNIIAMYEAIQEFGQYPVRL